MEIVFPIILIVVVLGLVRSFGGGGGREGGGLLTNVGLGSHDAQMEAAAHNYGVTLTHTYLIHSAGRYDANMYIYGFSGVDKAGVKVTGQIQVGVGRASLTFDSSGAGARAARAQSRLVEEELVDEATLDPEEQIRREVARRLDTLQANREAFLAHDTDGDGMVDAEEWAAARARIEEQVRREITGDTSRPAPPAEQPVTSSAQGDGQW